MTGPSPIPGFYDLLSQAWQAFDRAVELNLAVQPAIPILFFGDSEAYFASTLRIITVGLNPSGKEFPTDNAYLRFPMAQPADTDANGRDPTRHISALNEYFRTKPYKIWFNSFEPILNGFDSSYYNAHLNTALHTDIGSPIATDPTWSRLSKSERTVLRSDGIPLWHSLVRLLAPHIILISVQQRYLDAIEFPVLKKHIITTYDYARPYHVSATLCDIGSTSPACTIFGRAAQLPFGLLNADKKRSIGPLVEAWRSSSTS